MDAVKKDKKKLHCEKQCEKYNSFSFDKEDKRVKLLHKMLGKVNGKICIQAPLQFTYGKNIETGEGFYCNANLRIEDRGKVIFKNNVFIGANCHIISEKDKPVSIGNDVWIGSNVRIMAGVTIGNNVIISSRSVVTEDIPDNVVADGDPCRPKIDVDKK